MSDPLASSAARYEAGIEAALDNDDVTLARRLSEEYRLAAGANATGGASAPAVRAAYLSAQADAAGGFLAAALSHLARVLPHAESLPPPLARRVWVLAAELHARLGRPLEAATALAAADRHPSTTDTLPLRVRLARVRLLTGAVGAADVRPLVAELRAVRDHHNLAVLLCDAGRAWDTAGEAGLAAGCWREATAVAPQDGPSTPRAAAHLGLGRLAHLAGRYQDAFDAFAQSVTAAAGSPLHLEAVLRRLLVRLELNQEPAVWREFDALRSAVGDRVPDELDGVWGLLGWLVGGDERPPGAEAAGYAAVLAGEVEQARGAYRAAVAVAAGPSRRARAAMALGLLAVAAGDRREAVAELTEAERLAGEHCLPEVFARAVHGLGRVAAELDRDDGQARLLFERAAEAAEVQSAKLRSPADAASYRRPALSAIRELLRSAGRAADAGRVLRYQELDRGRLVLDLWRAAGRTPRHLQLQVDDLDRQWASATDAERAALTTARERLLDEFLLTRERASAAPFVPDLPALQQALPPGTAYLSLTRFPDELLLLAVTRDQAVVSHRADAAGRTAATIAAVQRQIVAHLDRYRAGFPVHPDGLDAALREAGEGPLGRLVRDSLDRLGPHVKRVVWVPDGDIHGLPVHALRVDGRHLIQRVAVAYGFGGGLLVRQVGCRRGWWRGGRPTVVIDSPHSLPAAEDEGAAVAGRMRRCRVLRGAEGTKGAVAAAVRGARVVHFACHAEFDPAAPLSAAVRLPAGGRWGLPDWSPEAPPRLAVLAACRTGEVGEAAGREVFGLTAGALAAGVGAVVAGLWPVADREAVPLIAAFYRHLVRHDPSAALAAAQREAIDRPGSTPLHWAVFALFGDPDALPPPPWWARWLLYR